MGNDDRRGRWNDVILQHFLLFYPTVFSRKQNPLTCPLFIHDSHCHLLNIRLLLDPQSTMGFSPLLITILLASSAAAKICKNVEVPFNVSARTGTFNIPTPISNSDATTFIQNLTRQGQNFTQKVLAGYKTTAGTYYISTQFCTPNEGLPQDATAQILTHGLGFDKR